MRIGVISDTHGNLYMAQKAIKQMGKIDLLLHAGDHYQDALLLEQELTIPVKSVKGNCDYGADAEGEKIIELAEIGVKIFLTHGHKYGVKSGLNRLFYRGLELGADIIIFGHTHIPFYQQEGKMHLLNPGSLALPIFGKDPTYALIEYDNILKIMIKKI